MRRRRPKSALYVLATGVFLTTHTGCTERAPEVTLPEPVPLVEWAAGVDTLPGTYTRAMYPAEFWDSVLVVPDVGERLLWRIDMVNGTREPLGSQGGGPGEYPRVSWALKVHRDSVAISPGMAWMPFAVIDVRAGKGRTMSFGARDVGTGTAEVLAGVAQPFLALSDTLGHLYGEAVMHAPSMDSAAKRRLTMGGMRDTSDIRRYSIRTGTTDTLTLLPKGVHHEPPGVDASGAMALGMGLGPYGAYSGWAATEDGRLILVDAATYGVRVFDRTMEPVAQWTFPSEPIAVSETGWEQYVQETTRGSIALVEKSLEQVLGAAGAKRPRPAGPRYVVPPMPSVLPPVRTNGGTRALHAWGNIAWIPVNRVDPPTIDFWDVLDIATGERLATVVLPANHRLIHVTKRGAYIVAKDDDDLERILLYRPPAARE